MDKTILNFSNENFDFSICLTSNRLARKMFIFLLVCVVYFSKFWKKLRNPNVNPVNVYCIIIHNIYILARQLDKIQR